MVDRATNRSRGFGFVTFETEEAVEAVMRNKCEMMGKWVEVKRAEPRDSRWVLFNVSLQQLRLVFKFVSLHTLLIAGITCVSEA